MKNIIILSFILVSFHVFAKRRGEACKIRVGVHGSLKNVKDSRAWDGSFKIGFERNGVMKLKHLKLGEEKKFKVSCYNTYVNLHIDYIAHPFLGELEIKMAYQGKSSTLKMKINNCSNANSDDPMTQKYCSGSRERIVDNIAAN